MIKEPHQAPSVTQRPRVRRALPKAAVPFSNAQFRLLAGGLTLSLFGGGIWILAVVWQVIELGGSPIQLSVVATGASIGLVGAVLFGGVLADRIPQKRILITVEVIKGVSIAAAAVLALSGNIEVWHLAVVSFMLGICDGFFYPAYSALLPSVLPAEHLLAANGIEGMLRPTIMLAAGPAAASAAIALSSPGFAFAITAFTQIFAVAVLATMRSFAVRREAHESAELKHPMRSMFDDLREGVRYVVRTPWLLGTLLFASVLVLLIMGPIEVLLPFAVKNQTGGGAGAFALALATFGMGGAIGSLVVASVKLPRRYLTVIVMLWGAGGLPLVIIGYTSQLWVIASTLFVVGFAHTYATVIWGTLLQRRVPPALLGRVSSLDFFVSLAFMPISMALAGPVGEFIGIAPAFVVAGVVPVTFGIATVLLAKMPKDEIEHPLDTSTVG
ncbi:MAG: MFS transporter [Homoserinimonas sp.]